MSRAIGKPLTHNQRKLLESSGVKDTTDWRYLKQETVSEDGHITKSGPKTIYLVFQNNVTGDTRRVAQQ